MNGQVITSLIKKDLTLYFRDRFFALITVLSLVFYIAIYFLMPSSVDETFEIAVFAETMPEAVAAGLAADGITYQMLDSEDKLRDRVEDGDYAAGIVLPADFEAQIAAGGATTLTVYYPADAPDERTEALTALFRSLGYAVSGQLPNVQIEQSVLGQDMLGQQIPPRDRMLPLFAILVLIVETMGLANLIATEVENRTIRALMVTPMTTAQLFIAKGIMGTSIAFTQAVILMLITGGLSHQPLLILVTLLLGALLVTGIGFLLATIARDLLAISAWSILLIIGLSLPAFSVMFPGTLSDWIKAIPTYYLVDTVHQVINFEAGWGDVAGNLLILLASGLLLVGASTILLKRRIA